jgi:beta-1,2-mannobiose phosphorylase / 1,2-beta-oligomannan phosphorylase
MVAGNRHKPTGLIPVHVLVLILLFASVSCKNKSTKDAAPGSEFAPEMVEFEPYKSNPVFTHGDSTAWDNMIRERGFILNEDSVYKMWYTGYKDDDTAIKYLGYATSKDGIHWQRYAGNPIYKDRWAEDMMIFKHEGKYHMYLEGYKDVAHLMISDDGITWKDQGDLKIVNTKGDTLPGPYGTPTVYVEDEKWYLFYEINDSAIWLATSTDKINFKNVSDEPVLKPGPEKYDLGAVAVNQIVKHKGKYYLYYHASADPGWQTNAGAWNSNAAMSEDLIHWTKYPGNPLVDGDHSSPITVYDGQKMRLYTMHPEVWMYEGKGQRAEGR